MGTWFNPPRREPVDHTMPVPPPAGYFWQVSRSMLALDGAPLYELGLWRDGQTPNEWGVDTKGKRVTHIPPVVVAHFRADRPQEIRRASQRALRDLGNTEWMSDVLADTNERLRAAGWGPR